MSGLQSAANIPELRRRVLFTLIMLAVYRMGVQIPTPGINGEALTAFFNLNAGTLFGMFNMFSGGALENFSIFALGIMPYISASIIIQLLTVVIPQLEALKKKVRLVPERSRNTPDMERCFSVSFREHLLPSD